MDKIERDIIETKLVEQEIKNIREEDIEYIKVKRNKKINIDHRIIKTHNNPKGE